MESDEKQFPAKDEKDENSEANVEQDEIDKVVDKEMVEDIENEQCAMSSDLDFSSISRNSDLSNNKSAISPSEDDVHKTSAPSSPCASTSNVEKNEASPPKNGDDPCDKDTSEDDEFSESEFANFDFNEGDIMEDEEEEEIPKRKIPQSPVEVVDLSSDSEGFKEKEEKDEYIITKVQDSESDDVPVEEIPVDLSLDSRGSAAQRIESHSAKLPAVHVEHIIPVIELSDDENDQNDNAQKESSEQAAAPTDDKSGATIDDSSGAPAADSSGAPADNSSGAPADDSSGAPADDSSGAPADDSSGAPADDSSGAPADDSSGAPADDSSGAPADDSSGAAADNTSGRVEEQVMASDEKVVVSEEVSPEQELCRKRKIESEGESAQKFCKYEDEV